MARPSPRDGVFAAGTLGSLGGSGEKRLAASPSYPRQFYRGRYCQTGLLSRNPVTERMAIFQHAGRNSLKDELKISVLAPCQLNDELCGNKCGNRLDPRP